MRNCCGLGTKVLCFYDKCSSGCSQKINLTSFDQSKFWSPYVLITVASTDVSRLIPVKDMDSLVRQEMTYEQISERLRIEHQSTNNWLSSMSV